MARGIPAPAPGQTGRPASGRRVRVGSNVATSPPPRRQLRQPARAAARELLPARGDRRPALGCDRQHAARRRRARRRDQRPRRGRDGQQAPGADDPRVRRAGAARALRQLGVDRRADLPAAGGAPRHRDAARDARARPPPRPRHPPDRRRRALHLRAARTVVRVPLPRRGRAPQRPVLRPGREPTSSRSTSTSASSR